MDMKPIMILTGNGVKQERVNSIVHTMMFLYEDDLLVMIDGDSDHTMMAKRAATENMLPVIDISSWSDEAFRKYYNAALVSISASPDNEIVRCAEKHGTIPYIL